MATAHPHISGWQCGLLPEIVYRLADKTPKAVYAQYPDSPTSYDSTVSPTLEADNLRHLEIPAVSDLQQNRALSYSNVQVFDNVGQLARTIERIQDSLGPASVESDAASEERLGSILEEYEESILDAAIRDRPKKVPEVQTFILTGSTGTIGPYILDRLQAEPSIKRIYCLNRKADAQSIEERQLKAAGLSPPEPGKVVFLHADLSRPQLGLDPKDYEQLLKDTTHIIHNAWPVNFNKSVESFKPNFTGLTTLFKLSAAADYPAKVMFISSFGSIMNLPRQDTAIPETFIKDLNAPFNNGYSQSKFVAESLCHFANRELGIPVTIARLGQAAGPAIKPGLWNLSEWLPSLVISSISLGALPDTLGANFERIKWMPVDLLANAMVEAALHDAGAEAGGFEVLHMVNPNSVSWKSMLSDFAAAIRSKTAQTVKVVSSQEWINRLEPVLETVMKRDDNREKLLRVYPAVKILGFFRETMFGKTAPNNVLSQEKTLQASKTLKEMPAVHRAWIEKWVGEWVAMRPELRASKL